MKQGNTDIFEIACRLVIDSLLTPHFERHLFRTFLIRFNLYKADNRISIDPSVNVD